MRVLDLPTPALLLDRARVERNAAAMRRRLTAAGVGLRPHLKTAKSIEVAQLATAGADGGLTVSTLAEAHAFAAAGFADLVYAVTMTAAKVPAAAAVVRAGARLGILADEPAMIAAIGAAAARASVKLDVYLEVDTGDHRTGVPPESPVLLEAAAAVAASPALALAGVLTHAGHVYSCRDRHEVAAVAEEERSGVTRAATRLRAAGYSCAAVSAGSTPAAVCAGDFAGLTEVRPGNYLFFDLFQWALGVCAVDEVALSVLATVVGVAGDRRRVILDAGALALSKDHSAARLRPELGYGCLTAVAGERLGDLRVVDLDQEHGFVEPVVGPMPALAVGDKVRVLPSHACLTAACFSAYQVIDAAVAEPQVIDRWPRIAGWYSDLPG